MVPSPLASLLQCAGILIKRRQTVDLAGGATAFDAAGPLGLVPAGQIEIRLQHGPRLVVHRLALAEAHDAQTPGARQRLSARHTVVGWTLARLNLRSHKAMS